VKLIIIVLLLKKYCKIWVYYYYNAKILQILIEIAVIGIAVIINYITIFFYDISLYNVYFS